MADRTRHDLAREILGFRKAQEWTQGELARRLGTTEATVSRWESGKSIPKPEHLQALAQLAAIRGMTRGFLDRYQNLRDRERVGTGLAHGVIVESHEVGTHTVQLLEDGSLVVNNSIRIERR
jgi:transcriptional regulator with XRE-family HTH domain